MSRGIHVRNDLPKNTDGGTEYMPRCPLCGFRDQVLQWSQTSHSLGYVMGLMNGFTLICTWSYSSLKNQNTMKSGLKYFRNSAGADAKTKSHFANIPRRACHCQDILYLDMSPQLLQDWHIHPTVHFQLKFVHRWWNYGRCISPLCFLWKNKSALKDR